MSYLIAVLPDRIQAEEAYTSLEKAGISTDLLTIVGRGYKSADEFGFVDPAQQAKKQAKFMAMWLIPFGFAAGFTFNAIAHTNVFTWTGQFGNNILGGLLGAMGGSMGSVFVGGGVGLSQGSGDALPYRNRLQEGKYLVIVNGSKPTQNKATPILRQFNPETLQGYTEQF
ncbi:MULTISPECIES: hypothetical protein [Spirulina sp. CCY15215]|uniref:hypothetical protein n=1 Tax=Spirulina sp. CCY15215 TaxID=2767591 RepID=UPI001951E4AE|nr:hypothetical protein [Spirulina major]